MAEYRVNADGTVNLRDAVTGNAYSIPESEAIQQMGQGLAMPLSDAATTAVIEREEYDSPITAGLLGAARGATLGLSDAIIGGLGGKEYLDKTARYNPTASSIGDVAGSVASIMIPGGPLARLGSAAAKLGRGSRLAAGIASEAAIGGAIGAGHNLSQAAMGRQIDSDAVIRGIAVGALTGFATAGLSAAAGSAKRALMGNQSAKAGITEAMGPATYAEVKALQGKLADVSKGVDLGNGISKIDAVTQKALRHELATATKPFADQFAKAGLSPYNGLLHLDDAIASGQSSLAAAAKAKWEGVGQFVSNNRMLLGLGGYAFGGESLLLGALGAGSGGAIRLAARAAKRALPIIKAGAISSAAKLDLDPDSESITQGLVDGGVDNESAADVGRFHVARARLLKSFAAHPNQKLRREIAIAASSPGAILERVRTRKFTNGDALVLRSLLPKTWDRLRKEIAEIKKPDFATRVLSQRLRATPTPLFQAATALRGARSPLFLDPQPQLPEVPQ